MCWYLNKTEFLSISRCQFRKKKRLLFEAYMKYRMQEYDVQQNNVAVILMASMIIFGKIKQTFLSYKNIPSTHCPLKKHSLFGSNFREIFNIYNEHTVRERNVFLAFQYDVVS